MYEDKLGWGWHQRIRSMLKVKKDLLTDEMIEAPLNLEGATFIIYGNLGVNALLTDPPETPMNQDLYRKAFLHTLAAVICPALESRTKGSSRDFEKLAQDHLAKGEGYLSALLSTPKGSS